MDEDPAVERRRADRAHRGERARRVAAPRVADPLALAARQRVDPHRGEPVRDAHRLPSVRRASARRGGARDRAGRGRRDLRQRRDPPRERSGADPRSPRGLRVQAVPRGRRSRAMAARAPQGQGRRPRARLRGLPQRDGDDAEAPRAPRSGSPAARGDGDADGALPRVPRPSLGGGPRVARRDPRLLQVRHVPHAHRRERRALLEARLPQMPPPPRGRAQGREDARHDLPLRDEQERHPPDALPELPRRDPSRGRPKGAYARARLPRPTLRDPEAMSRCGRGSRGGSRLRRTRCR